LVFAFGRSEQRPPRSLPACGRTSWSSRSATECDWELTVPVLAKPRRLVAKRPCLVMPTATRSMSVGAWTSWAPGSW